MIKISLFKLAIIMVLTFFVGYFVRSIHYKQDLPYLEKAQAEIRLELDRIESKGELAEAIDLLLDDYWKVIDQNRKHPVIVFIKEGK